MWYLLDSEPYASLRCGLKEELSADDIIKKVDDSTICDSIAQYDVKAGDCFYIPAGRVHSIGAGCLIAELQQTSDTTYRLYDYNRRDSNGNLRQLHVRQAAECIDYTVREDYRQTYKRERNVRVPLVECKYFKTSLYDIDRTLQLDYSNLYSFVILICVKGSGTFTNEEENSVPIRECETVLIPATTTTLEVKGNLQLLEHISKCLCVELMIKK